MARHQARSGPSQKACNGSARLPASIKHNDVERCATVFAIAAEAIVRASETALQLAPITAAPYEMAGIGPALSTFAALPPAARTRAKRRIRLAPFRSLSCSTCCVRCEAE
eukprot:12483409-Alexandrium_andersonii.AAC.1